MRPDCRRPDLCPAAKEDLADMNCPCGDCGIETLPTDERRAEFYMVTDATWAEAQIGRVFMCVGCIEARLGRQLGRGDFIACPVNDLTTYDNPRRAWSYRTARLTDRLQGAAA